MTQKGVEKAGLIVGCVFIGSIVVACLIFVVIAIIQAISSPTKDNIYLILSLMFSLSLPFIWFIVSSKWDGWFHKLPKG